MEKRSDKEELVIVERSISNSEKRVEKKNNQQILSRNYVRRIYFYHRFTCSVCSCSIKSELLWTNCVNQSRCMSDVVRRARSFHSTQFMICMIWTFILTRDSSWNPMSFYAISKFELQYCSFIKWIINICALQ